MVATHPIPDGVWPVMLTPFRADRSIDYAALDQLVEFYLEAGVAGLFAVCQSSEMFDLSDGERVQLAEHIVRRCAGRVPVIASGTFGRNADEIALNVRRMADTGVTAVVCLTTSFATAAESEASWQEQATMLLDSTGTIPLGLYECPQPYHRVLSADCLAWAAATDRFLFLKETSSSPDLLAAKLSVVRGTREKLFNANAETLLGSLQQGANGFSGISANFVPELWVWMCRNWREEPGKARALQSFLRAAEAVFSQSYPMSAKFALGERGLAVGLDCRTAVTDVSAAHRVKLRALLDEAKQWQQQLAPV